MSDNTRTIRLVRFETWGVSNDTDGTTVNELIGSGANGGRYRILIPASRENVKELAYATGRALDNERDQQDAMEEYAIEAIAKPEADRGGMTWPRVRSAPRH